MAYTAIYDGEERGAWAIPAGEDAYCMECGERMRVWREGVDGTARHVSHINNMGGGEGGGTDCGGGEDDDDIKWKNFAAERLQEVFGDLAPTDTPATVEERLAAPASDKGYRDADALIYFDPADEQFGRALAVEVQNENKDKDIDAVTEDYVRQGIAVVWLYEDDFNNDGCKLNETDFRRKARQSIDSILLDQNPVPWYLHIKRHSEILLDGVRKAREELNREDCEHDLIEREHHTPAKLPEEYWNELRRWYWFNTEFEKKLNPPEEYEFDFDYEIEAKYPADWEYKRLHHHLGEHNADHSCDICNGEATVYVHEDGFRCGDCGPWPDQRRQNPHSTV